MTKIFSTHLALKWLLYAAAAVAATVHLFMPLQIMCLAERLLAYITGEWLLPTVKLPVYLQGPQLGEGGAT